MSVTSMLESLAADVRSKRQDEGLSHKELATKLAIGSYADLCRFELGHKDIRLSTAVKLTRWLES